jgi:Plasmid pRiA4b ORF-3-like protein
VIEDRRPSRRRPRRSDEVTYRVRIDLKDARPPIWRRLDVSSHLRLDEVHEIIQTAFEWTDSHLHRFESPVIPTSNGRQFARAILQRE